MWPVCLSLLAGVYTLQLISIAWLPGTLVAAGLVSIVLLCVGLRRAVIAFWLGLTGFWLVADAVIKSRIAPDIAGDSLLTEVRIVDFPRSREGAVSFVAVPMSDVRVPPRIRVSWFEPPVELRPGDTWQLELRLRRPRGRFNPGAFDFEAWLTRERIGAVGYVVNGPRNHLRRSGSQSAVQRLRESGAARIHAVVRDEDPAAVLAAITVGTRHRVTEEQWQRFRATGTSHLMAISGLHIGLATAAAYVVFASAIGLAMRRRNARVPALLLSLAVACGYATVSGFGTPAQRATLMIAIALIAGLARRPQRAGHVLAQACCVLVVAEPLATMSPGFKLSFAAVALLCWLSRFDKPIRAREGRHYGALVTALRQLAALQFALLLGLLPLTATLFARVSLVAPAVNLLAVPVFGSITVPLALVGLVLDGTLAPVGDRLLAAAATSIRLLLVVIEQAAALPGAEFSIAEISGTLWLTLGLTVTPVVLPRGWPGRAIAVLAVATIVVHRPSGPPAGCADVDVLDVGQGLAVSVRTERAMLLFDTGPAYRNGRSGATTTILPYLQYRGIRQIDTLVVSHADIDHAGGVTAILDAVPVARVLVGEPLPGIADTTPCRAGQRWRWDSVLFRIVYPPATASVSGNAASCVLEISAGLHRLLLTGDIERAQEQELVASGFLRRSDVVLVPHHGSRTSSSTAFVAALEPAIAIVAAGHANRWGFPKPDVSRRWAAAGARVHATSEQGPIGLRVCETDGLRSVVVYRDGMRRIWHERSP